MPRQSKQSGRRIGQHTLVVDNGAYTMKAGFAPTSRGPAGVDAVECRVIPNCIARRNDGPQSHQVYVADQLDSCRDFAEMQFRRPVEKGYVVNWEAEMEIWRRCFFEDRGVLQCDPHETNLVLTEAPNCPAALQANCDQIIFEEFEFTSAYRCQGPTVNAYNDIPTLMGDQNVMPEPNHGVPPAECVVIVDSGFSHTTVTCVFQGHPLQSSIRRLDVGGKIMTNFLKETISLRHFGLMDDSHLVSQIKEDACFVSQDFHNDLSRTWKGSRKETQSPHITDSLIVDYVLPDYRNTFRGFVRPHDPSVSSAARAKNAVVAGPREDYFPLGNERFVVPELLFNPTDIGLQQAGLPETIIQSLSVLPPGMWPGFLANIVVIGGNAKLEGFQSRLSNELRALTPSEMKLRVQIPQDPIKYTWLGAARMASDTTVLKDVVVTKQEYEEYGSIWTARKFAGQPP